MQQALTEGGPEAALRACADEAQGLTALVQAQTGVRVGRTSLRLRNPANAGPDWVLLWLEANKEAQRDAVTSYEQIDETESGRVARIATPIFIGPQCLTCHGPSDARPPALAAVLAARYPSDEAHGYENGALRGAIWAESLVD